MAICFMCGQEMMTADTCAANSFKIDDRDPNPENWIEYESIPFNGEYSDRCPDCGVKAGGWHHPDCDMEQCPACGGQWIMCQCCV